MKKEKYVVLCVDGGKHFDVAMFKIYTLKAGILKFYMKLNKNEYLEFINKNKSYNLELYINSSLSEIELDIIDEKARAVKYSGLLRDTLKEVKDWMTMLEHLEIIGLRDVLAKVSTAVNRLRKPHLTDNE